MSATIKLHGFEELKRNFERLSDRAANTVVRKAAHAGAAPLRATMKRKAPKRTGDLRKSIRTVGRKRRLAHTTITGPSNDYRGGPAPGSRKRRNVPRNYFHLLEYGFTARNGRPVPARPFARPTFDEQQDAAVKATQDKLAVEIMAEARKLKVTRRD